MEEDPLIPLVHVWNNAAFDNSSSSASAWQTHTAAAAAAAISKGDKENRRPDTDDIGAGFDADAEIGHIEAEILRLSSRLHHLRTSRQSEPKRDADAATGEIAAKVRPRPRGLSLGPLDVISGANPNLLSEKQPPPAVQRLKPIKQPPVSRGRGLSLGPLDIAAANPKVPAAQQQKQGTEAARILKPIKEPPVQRRRGVSLGPLEIHHCVGSKPAAAAAVKPFPNQLNAIREEGQISKQPAVPAKPWPSSNTRHPLDAKQGAAAGRAKARSSSMSPRSKRQSIAKATDTRGGSAAVGGNKVVDELKPKGVFSHTGNAAIGRRPAGSSKVRVIPSRYSLTPGASLGAGTQEKRRKQSLQGSAGGASQREEIRAKVIEPSNDQQSPQTIAKVAELLPRIRTMPCDESPRDSGCAKRVADLVGKRYFFTAAAGDGTAVSSYQARVLEVEAPEAAAAEA